MDPKNEFKMLKIFYISLNILIIIINAKKKYFLNLLKV